MKIRSDHSETIDERGRTVITTPPVAGSAAPDANVIVPVATEARVSGHVIGAETVRTSRTSGFTPSALVAGIAAIVMLVLGGITAARAGIDSSLDDPVVTVAGYTATALLGVIEIAFGLILLTAALTRSRSAILFLGIIGGVMALVAVFQPSVGEGSLAIERGFAVIAAIVMGAVIVSALLPTIMRTSVVQRTDDVA